jgi:CubicO group peptidase (beta-lactamase class C family)
MNKVRSIKLLIFLTIVSFSSSLFLHSKAINPKAISKLVRRTMKTFHVPGIAVAVIRDGRIIHAGGYGLRSINSKKKVDTYTLFAIASNSKAFTSAALAILDDEGKLKWDDRVIDFIPKFRLYNPYVTQEFTIIDLLTHRSGLGLGAGDLMIFPGSSDFTIDDLIHNLRYLKPVSSFRSKYDYDNLMYIVAGEIVARVSGMSWEEFVENRIMKPLGMNHSAGSFNRLKDKSNIAAPHAVVEGEIQVIDRYDLQLTGPAGGIYTNIDDLSKWVLMQLNRGKFSKDPSRRLFSEKNHSQMWTPQTILPLRSGEQYKTHFNTYGLGWRLCDVKGYKQISHTGGLPGMVTQVTLIPELKLGIIVFTNQQSGAAFTSITNQIKDSYLGIADTDRIWENLKKVQSSRKFADKILKKVWDEVKSQQKTAQQQHVSPNLYIGTYRDNWFGRIIISKDRGKLRFTSLRSPKLTGKLLLYKGNAFIVKWDDRRLEADAFVLFELNFNGNPTGIRMKAVSPLTDFSYDFQDLHFKKID